MKTQTAHDSSTSAAPAPHLPAVGRATLTQRHAARPVPLQDDDAVRGAAAHGIAGGGGPLPHLDAIQRAFGDHDVSGISAHVGGAAADACDALGAHGYATGESVAFAESPSLFLVAHEAAHVVQQRAGVHLSSAVGAVGDAYEQHADAVAARVVAGESAAELLGPVRGGASAAVQRKGKPAAPAASALDAERKEGLLEATGQLYQDILEQQALAVETIYQAQMKQQPPPWDERLVKLLVTKGIAGACALLGAGMAGPAAEAGAEVAASVVSKVAELMGSLIEKALHAKVEDKLGTRLPGKNPALAFFIPVKESLVASKHDAQQAFLMEAKPLLKAEGSLDDIKAVHAALSRTYRTIRAAFERELLDRWMVYLASARYGADKAGNTRMDRAHEDMEAGMLGRGPTGVLLVRLIAPDQPRQFAHPAIDVLWFDTFGLGEDMRELLVGQQRKVKDLHCDVRMVGAPFCFDFWPGGDRNHEPRSDRFTAVTVTRDARGNLADQSDDRGAAWLELLGRGQDGAISAAFGPDGVDPKSRQAGVQRLFDLVGEQVVDGKRLKSA